jgi:alpha-D-xyloside xylohydrolase
MKTRRTLHFWIVKVLVHIIRFEPIRLQQLGRWVQSLTDGGFILPQSTLFNRRENRDYRLHYLLHQLLPLFFLGLACSSNSQGQLKVTRTSQDVRIAMPDGVLSIQPIIDGVIRVRFARFGTIEAPSVVLAEKLPVPDFTVEEDKRAITVSTSKLRVVLERSSQALTYTDGSGKVLLQEKPGERLLKAVMSRSDHGTMAEQSFISPSDEYLFGTGQFQDGYLNVKGLPRRLTQVNTQIAIPFLLSSKGYGLLWHNYGLTDFNPADTQVALSQTAKGLETAVDVTTAAGTQLENRQAATFKGEFNLARGGQYGLMLDVGQSMARHYRVEIDGTTRVESANYWLPPTTSWLMNLTVGKHTVKVSADVKDHPTLFLRRSDNLTTLRSPDADAIDYVVFAGPSSDEVISRYREVTGAAPLMPLWAYGYIHCRERFKSQEELLTTAEEFRQSKLPMDVIVQDWQYWGHYGWNAMRFDEKEYPDSAAMVEKLHKMHVHLMVSVWSKVDPSAEIGKEFTAKSYYIPGTEWIDFFNPAAASLYWQDLRSRMLSLGIDAWWLDATEPENDDLHGRMVTGASGDAVRLLYPLYVNKTVYEGQRKDAPDKRVFILTRSAFAGQQRYASATWSGDIGNDWDSLKRQIPAGLDFSASGLPYWTTDTGGFFRPGPTQFSDPAYRERFLRWLEFSTFSPLMRVHGYQTDTEFWRYGKQVEDISRKYLDLRYRLLPYIYSNAAEVTMHGSTIMRPLVMDFAQDDEAMERKYEYMFGREFLVAPVLAPGVQSWDVYLPNCQHGWVNFWTGQTFQGGQTVKTAARLDELPLYVRAGSIVPFGPTEEWAGEKPDAPIEIRVYPGADATFSLYEDEGTNYNYERGAYSIISLKWNDRDRELTIGKRKGSFSGMRPERRFSLAMARLGVDDKTEIPKTIFYNGDPVTVHLP